MDLVTVCPDSRDAGPDGSFHFRAVIRLQRPLPPAPCPVRERGSQMQNGVETTSETSGLLRRWLGCREDNVAYLLVVGRC